MVSQLKYILSNSFIFLHFVLGLGKWRGSMPFMGANKLATVHCVLYELLYVELNTEM